MHASSAHFLFLEGVNLFSGGGQLDPGFECWAKAARAPAQVNISMDGVLCYQPGYPGYQRCPICISPHLVSQGPGNAAQLQTIRLIPTQIA